MEPDDLLSIPEIAKLAEVSERTIRSWMNSGRLEVDDVVWRGAQCRRYARRATVENTLALIRLERSQRHAKDADETTHRP